MSLTKLTKITFKKKINELIVLDRKYSKLIKNHEFKGQYILAKQMLFRFRKIREWIDRCIITIETNEEIRCH